MKHGGFGQDDNLGRLVETFQQFRFMGNPIIDLSQRVERREISEACFCTCTVLFFFSLLFPFFPSPFHARPLRQRAWLEAQGLQGDAACIRNVAVKGQPREGTMQTHRGSRMGWSGKEKAAQRSEKDGWLGARYIDPLGFRTSCTLEELLNSNQSPV